MNEMVLIDRCSISSLVAEFKMNSQRRLYRRVIQPWISAIFFFVLFYVLGYIVFHWWGNEFWIWLIIGFFILSAIVSTIRFFVYKQPTVAFEPEARYFSDNSQEYIPSEDKSLMPSATLSTISEKAETRYCSFCGAQLEPGSKFCKNCGAEIQQ